MKRVSGTLLCLSLLLTGPGCLHRIREGEIFTFPSRGRLPETGPGARAVELLARDGTPLRGRLFGRGGGRPLLLYFYGQGECVLSAAWRLQWLADAAQVDVACVDYRGYGGSAGTASMVNLREDALALFDHFQRAEPARPILVQGYSLGSIAAIHVAAHRPAAGVVLHAPIPSAEEVVPNLRTILPWYLKPFVWFRPDEALKAQRPTPLEEAARIRQPVLVLQGARDDLVPPRLARKVFDAMPSGSKRYLEVPGADHNTLNIREEPARGALMGFLKAAGGA